MAYRLSLIWYDVYFLLFFLEWGMFVLFVLFGTNEKMCWLSFCLTDALLADLQNTVASENSAPSNNVTPGYGSLNGVRTYTSTTVPYDSQDCPLTSETVSICFCLFLCFKIVFREFQFYYFLQYWYVNKCCLHFLVFAFLNFLNVKKYLFLFILIY